jgi:hypothetical protein
MRCLACDRKLNDREATRKYSSSGTFVDLCNKCFSEVAEDIPDLDGDTGVDHVEEATDEGTDYQQFGYDDSEGD